MQVAVIESEGRLDMCYVDEHVIVGDLVYFKGLTWTVKELHSNE